MTRVGNIIKTTIKTVGDKLIDGSGMFGYDSGTPAWRPLNVDSAGKLEVTGGGGGAQFAEDTAHTTADKGTMAIAVRNDTASALAGTDGDYIPLTTDSLGRLWIHSIATPMAKASNTATNNVTFDDSTSTDTSSDIDTSAYDYGYLEINLDVANAPTDIVIEVLTGMSATPTFKIMDGPLGDLRYEDSAGNKDETIRIPYLGDYTCVKATATGTDASKTFTLTTKIIGVTNGY